MNIGGHKVIRGGNGIVDGRVDDVNWTVVMEAMERRSFKHLEEANARLSPCYFFFICDPRLGRFNMVTLLAILKKN